jgi:hypothetical protein
MPQLCLKGRVILQEKEEGDSELDNTIAQLGIAEYQVNKLQRFLASRLDRSNPVGFSKGSSTYAFESRGREYRITIEVDTFDMGDRPATKRTATTRSIRNALKSPAFIITSIMFSALICVVAILNLYWTSPALGTFSDRELSRLDSEYSLILYRCGALMDSDDPPNPRSFGALYSTCNKAILQLQEFCKVNHITTCEDQRIQLYLTGNKARP